MWLPPPRPKVVFGEFLNENANFCTFPAAFLTLFRCTTGEGWNSIMHDVMIRPGDTGTAGQSCSVEKGNCGSWLAVSFFASFLVLSAFIILKM